MTRTSTARLATDWAVRALGALLCVGVIVVHIEDQGGVTAFADPDWFGWAYRLVELVAAITAVALLTRLLPRLTWLVALGVAAGPFVGYLLTRTVGLPGDSDDIGNWADPVGTASLVIEGVLIVVAAVSLYRATVASREIAPTRSEVRSPTPTSA